MLERISVLLIIMMTISCGYSDTPVEVVREGVSISIPGYMDEEELAEDGIIEYANRFRNMYLVVLKDNNDNIDSAVSKSIERLTKGLKEVEVKSISNDSTGVSTEIKAIFDKEKNPIYYYQKTIKSNNGYRILTVWTRGDERKDKYSKDISSILSSFKTVE